jgi:hypothetical protein
VSAVRELAAALPLACPLIAVALLLTACSPSAALRVAVLAAALVMVLTCLIPAEAPTGCSQDRHPLLRVLLVIQVSRSPQP